MQFARRLAASLALGWLGIVCATPASAACPLVVDAGGGGDHTTIQSAVDAFRSSGGNLGPCSIEVRPGVYTESVELVGVNGGAGTEAQRLLIEADPGAQIRPGSHHAFLLRSTRFVTIQGFEVTGAANEPFSLDGGRNANRNTTLEANRVVNNGGGRDSGCIAVASGNTDVWVVNNVCRHNGAHGMRFGSGGPSFAVNNIVLEQEKDGILVDAGANLVLANNLILFNGSGGGAQYGVELMVKASVPSSVRLLHNLFYRNDAGDVANLASAVESTGNHFTASLGSLTLGDFFVEAASGDLHHAQRSPAIDAGASSTGTVPERVPEIDFEGDPRVAPIDIGADELSDEDRDGVPDTADNCPPGLNSSFNPGQEDRDGDGIGDYCDNCPKVANPGQEDANGSSRGDACEEVAETLFPCAVGAASTCTFVVHFDALQYVQTIPPDCLNTYFYCKDSLGRPLPRSEQLAPPRGTPNDVTSFGVGSAETIACDLADHFPLAAFGAGTYSCKACYTNFHQDPDIGPTGTCGNPDGCQDLFQGITCSAPVSITVDPNAPRQACSPGFWKNDADKRGAVQWARTGFAPTDDFDSVFGTDLFSPNVTLLTALGLLGGNPNALARHAVAGLLSAAHPGVSYPLAVGALRSLVQSGDSTAVLEELSTLSGLACPLSSQGL